MVEQPLGPLLEELIETKPPNIYDILDFIKHSRLCFRGLFSVHGLSLPKLEAIAQDLRALVALQTKYANDKALHCYLQKTCFVIDYAKRLALVEAHSKLF